MNASQRASFIDAVVTCRPDLDDVFQACWRGDHDGAVRILSSDPTRVPIRHADPNGADGFYNGLPYCGLTPLHYAVIAGDSSMAQLLLSRGA